MGRIERTLSKKGFKIVEDLTCGSNRSVYLVECQGRRSIVKVPQLQRPLCEDHMTVSGIDLRCRIAHNMNEAQFLREMKGHPMIPELFGEFTMPMQFYLIKIEAETEGVMPFVQKNGIVGIHQELIKGRKLREAERITDLAAKQRLIDFFKQATEKGYSAFDLGELRNDILIDGEGMPHVIDFGTVRKFDDSAPTRSRVKWELETIEKKLF